MFGWSGGAVLYFLSPSTQAHRKWLIRVKEMPPWRMDLILREGPGPHYWHSYLETTDYSTIQQFGTWAADSKPVTGLTLRLTIAVLQALGPLGSLPTYLVYGSTIR